MSADRQPPANNDAECAVLGSILIDQDARTLVAAIVQPDDFYQERHKDIYRAILACKDAPPDHVTVSAKLEEAGTLDQIGGPAYLTSLINYVPTSVHVEHYARIVAERAICRRLVDIGTKIVGKAWTGTADDALAFARSALLSIDRRGEGRTVAASTVAGQLYDHVEEWAMHPLEFGQVRDLSTCIPSLDRMIGGLCPGHLVLVAGRPGMGKSSLVFEIARRVADAGNTVFIISLEMPKTDIFARWASAISGIETRRVRRGVCPDKYIATGAAPYFVSLDDLSQYLAALGHLGSMKTLFVDDSRALTTAEIRARTMRLAQRTGGIDLLVIDHTGRIGSGLSTKGENTATVEGRKSRDLSDLAGELGCPVLLAQQLNRNAAGDGKRPTLEELRDSGQHEENAHVVLGLYRESYYKENLLGDDALALEVRSLKHREGPAGVKTRIRYEPNLSRFGEFEEKKR